MKIGIFDPYLDTLSGGEKYMLTAASCLSKNHSVSIFWDESTEIKNKAKEKLGIDLGRVNFNSNIFKKDYPKTKRLLETKKFDAIIYLSDGSIPTALCKLIIHFQFPVEWVKNDLKTRLKMLRVSEVICNSQFTKFFIDKKFNINSIVLYPPCEIKNVQNKKENIILHVGRFGIDLEGKNFKKQDIMIEAFKKLKPDWKFVLVIGFNQNKKNEVKKLKEQAKGLNIQIVENPDNNTLWEYYSKSKIYWHASGLGEDLVKHPERAEHFGISTVEAMGAGVVPVVINAGGQKEIVEDGKSGFLWNSIEELVQKTKRLMGDNVLWEKMSGEAKIRSKKFTGDRFCRQLYEIIK